MFHNTAYAIPSGYDARKPVKTLKPLVYTRLSSFLVIVLELRNFSHFKSESDERKQKIVVWGEVRGKLSFLEKNARMPFLVSLFGATIFLGCISILI